MDDFVNSLRTDFPAEKDPFVDDLSKAMPSDSAVQAQAQDSMMNKVYSRFPALKNLGGVTLKADQAFTREATGAGSIETFQKGDKRGVHYNTGLFTPHPDPTGNTIGVVYNPNENNDQNIALDLLHGMKHADPQYAQMRNEFGKALIRNYPDDLKQGWKDFNEQTNGRNDGFENYKQFQFIDGMVRNLLIEGTPEEIKKQRYMVGAREEYLRFPDIKKTFGALENHLRTGLPGYMLPEATVKP